MDRTSLRWAYVFIGVVLMVTAVLWLRSVRANSAPREGRALHRPIVQRTRPAEGVY